MGAERRTVARRAAALAAVVVLVGVGVAGWRWRDDRRYVGTNALATITWGQCLNAISWTDPATGVSWWAGHDIQAVGAWESETPRARLVENPWAFRTVLHRSVGTVHFASYDRAIFTSRTGGTLGLVRPPREQAYTADCVGGGPADPPLQPAWPVWAQVTGALGDKDPGTGDVLLRPGTITVHQDGMADITVPVSGRSAYSVPVPVGTVTVSAVSGDQRCGGATIDVAGGDHRIVDLLCSG